MYEFQVQAQAQFEPDQSDPLRKLYRFSYTITVTNASPRPAQLIARYWLITDAEGSQQQVKGLGVVGRQPLLQPGESFSYSSGCEIHTPTGTMQGHYVCVDESGEPFQSPIPLFVLHATDDGSTVLAPAPHTLH